MRNDRMRAGSVVVVIALVTGFLSAAVHGQSIQGTSADEQAIRDLVALHSSASQQDDLEALVAGLRADADSRRADGRILSGRAEIEKRYRDVLSGDRSAWRTLNHPRQFGFASCSPTWRSST